MDLTFKTPSGIFNYRVCAIILHDDALLATKNDRTPYFFLPGGRVQLHEDAESAIRRELLEELNLCPTALRPLWLNQGFFTEDVTQEKFHELCLYYLVDISGTDLPSRGNPFLRTEGDAEVGTNVDAITGATVTSKAVARCVNSAVGYVTGADAVSAATTWGG